MSSPFIEKGGRESAGRGVRSAVIGGTQEPSCQRRSAARETGGRRAGNCPFWGEHGQEAASPGRCWPLVAEGARAEESVELSSSGLLLFGKGRHGKKCLERNLKGERAVSGGSLEFHSRRGISSHQISLLAERAKGRNRDKFRSYTLQLYSIGYRGGLRSERGCSLYSTFVEKRKKAQLLF